MVKDIDKEQNRVSFTYKELLGTWEDNIKEFKTIFENEKIQKIGYKLKQDYILLKEMGIDLKNFAYDIEIAGYIIDSIKNKYDIETLSLRYLNIELSRYIKNEEEPNQMSLFNMIEEDTEKDKNKACIYAYAIDKIYAVTKKLMEEQEAEELFKKIEMPLAPVLADMELTGVKVDNDVLETMKSETKIKIDALTKEIYELAGEEFNIASPKQLGEILFLKLGLPGGKKTTKGYKTDMKVLHKLLGMHPMIEKILEYRNVTKLYSTYLEGMQNCIGKDNKIHTIFKQNFARTGRLSSTEPNLQNIPVRDEEGRKTRKAFLPCNDSFLSADYSQIELRLLAHIADDEVLKNAFLNDADIHTKVAADIHGITENEVTKKMRSTG